MEIWIKAGQLLLSLSLLIVLHELGHFIPAKLFKTRVEKFYLFFDAWFSLWKTKKGDTEYGIGWLPLGGYVKISGMIDESMDTEQMEKEPQPWEFRSKPVWQRLIIMIGGVTVNIIVGILVYIMIIGVWGKDELRPNDLTHGYEVPPLFEKYGFQDGDIILEIDGEEVTDSKSNYINNLILQHNAKDFKVRHQDGSIQNIELPEDIDFQAFKKGEFFALRQEPFIGITDGEGTGAKAGLQVGDKVLAVNGGATPFFQAITDSIQANKGKKMDFTVMRGEEELSLSITTNDDGKVGIGPKALVDEFKITHVSYSFLEAIPAGWDHAIFTLKGYVGGMKFLATKKGVSSVGGFGTFGNLFPPTWEWRAFWEITAFISIILAFMNILPIPALDGGHVMFLIYEAISGRPPNQKVLEYAQIVGFVLILSLVLYANANDIIRAFG